LLHSFRIANGALSAQALNINIVVAMSGEFVLLVSSWSIKGNMLMRTAPKAANKYPFDCFDIDCISSVEGLFLFSWFNFIDSLIIKQL
jgi:hypothetical protein